MSVGALAIGGLAGCAESAAVRGTTITNVLLIDGNGRAPAPGNLRILGDTIAAVGAFEPPPGDSMVDGGGLALAPGFIDSHSHHDHGLVAANRALPAVSQGITTIVAGQDGGHPYPLAITLDSLERAGHAVNVAFFAGHGALRQAVMGDDFRRKATPAEVDSMAKILEGELGAGALGLSTGLEYDPGIYSDFSEVVALAKVAARAGGRYASHIRSEDRDFWSALDEAIAVGREAGLPVQVSHLKLSMVSLLGRADSVIRVLDRARQDGVAVTADIYPYPYWHSTLQVLFPNRDFDNRAEAEKVLREIVRPEGLLLGRYAPNPTYQGRTVAEIAADRAEDPATTLMALIRDAQAHQRTIADHSKPTPVESVVATAMDEADIERLVGWPMINFCSDGELEGAHPRGYGAFPRVLARYVRERRVLSLEEAVRRMTALAAANMGLPGRGRLAPGYAADLVLFDPDGVADRATPAEPQRISAGIVGVWVGGESVFHDGLATGALPGRILRRSR